MKLTKGKQKIEMKKIENYQDRMVTLSKRKAGIFKKINEIITLCDVEVSFLVFSQAGKPHSFAHPSMEDALDRVKSSLGLEPSEKDNVGPLVEAYKRQQNEEDMKKLGALYEKLEMLKEKEKKLKEAEGGWWKIPIEGSSVEEKKRRHQEFVELVQRLGQDGDGSSSGRAERGHCGGGKE